MISVTGGGRIKKLNASSGINIQYPEGPIPIIQNTGVLDIIAGSNINIEKSEENVYTISQPAQTGVSTLEEGEGIEITNPQGPSTTVTNTGVITLVNGTNTTVSNVGTTWKVDAVGGISSVTAGAGIYVGSATGPNVSIANTGVRSIQAGLGISITGTTQAPTINNTGVYQLVNGVNTQVQSLGSGVWQIDSITEGSTALNPLVLYSDDGTNSFIFDAEATAGQYNPLVQALDQIVVASGTNSSSKNLTLTCQSSTTTGVKIYPEHVLIGAGGTSSTPQTRIEIGVDDIKVTAKYALTIEAEDTLTIKGQRNVSIDSTAYFFKVPQITATMPGPNISTNEIPTTAWVKSAIDYYQFQYTYAYTTDLQTITVPSNCQYVDLTVLSQGGDAGTDYISTNDPSQGINTTFQGGTGAGGTYVNLQKMVVRSGQKFYVDISNNATEGPTGGWIRLYYSNGTSNAQNTKLCDVAAGYEGTNGAYDNPGNGGQPGPTPFVNGDFGTWFIRKGKAGEDGKQVQSNQTLVYGTPGSPFGRPWVLQERGCGQQTTSGARGGAVVYITYYYT